MQPHLCSSFNPACTKGKWTLGWVQTNKLGDLASVVEYVAAKDVSIEIGTHTVIIETVIFLNHTLYIFLLRYLRILKYGQTCIYIHYKSLKWHKWAKEESWFYLFYFSLRVHTIVLRVIVSKEKIILLYDIIWIWRIVCVFVLMDRH